MEGLKARIQSLHSPYCTFGQIPLNDRRITLHFSPDEDGEESSSIKFPLSNDSGLDALIRACKQATFGRADLDENVLDPSYRRALVLEAGRFAIAPASTIDPGVLGITSSITAAMFQGTTSTNTIVARLDKLNVYQTGDFFKGHVDTPYSTNMFGTLLINLPVKHEGGQLVIYAPNRDWDEASAGAAAAKEVEQSRKGLEDDLCDQECYTTTWGQEDSLSWVAFFSDCPHKVLPVTSGNRVTLSFSLFLEPGKLDHQAGSPHIDPAHLTVPALEDLVKSL
ncbi:hypothetical protein DL93DRAFT_2074934 [Clavulina sp. PMI_390]|nr:hypothetical protein DL93DRAFT_2074934 [Clavulina sp. PMI_390]